MAGCRIAFLLKMNWRRNAQLAERAAGDDYGRHRLLPRLIIFSIGICLSKRRMDHFRIATILEPSRPWDLGARCLTATTCEDPRMASLPHGEEPGDGQDIRLVVDTIPTLAWSAGPDGSADFFNQRWLDYTGLSAKQALGSGWEVAIHPDD